MYKQDVIDVLRRQCSAPRWHCTASSTEWSLAGSAGHAGMANSCRANARSCGNCFCSCHQVSISWFASTRLCRWLVTSSVFTGVEWSPSNNPFGKKQTWEITKYKWLTKNVCLKKIGQARPVFYTKMYGPARSGRAARPVQTSARDYVDRPSWDRLVLPQ